MRTHVGWFSLPVCALIYEVKSSRPRPSPPVFYICMYIYVYIYIYIFIYICTRTARLRTQVSSCALLTPAAPYALQLAKYCALHSSKGYAVG